MTFNDAFLLDEVAQILNNSSPYPESVWFTDLRSKLRNTGRECNEPEKIPIDPEINQGYG